MMTELLEELKDIEEDRELRRLNEGREMPQDKYRHLQVLILIIFIIIAIALLVLIAQFR